jgi:DHA3 family macrolide efflux protein-like MFS transporter
MSRDGGNPLWRTFLLIWFGQSISVLGSRLTSFALTIWIFKRTGSVTVFGLAVLVFTLPGVLMAPFAGALVDRRGRRWAMIRSNTGAALATFAAVLLLLSHHLEPWHLCLILAANSVCESFHQPAYVAAVTLLVPKEQFGRSSGMIQLSQAGARILAPGLAGALIQSTGLAAVLWVDLATFLLALLILSRVRLPEAPPVPGPAAPPSLRAEILDSWRYIREHSGLMQLAVFSAGGGFVMSMLEVLMLPLILTFASPAAAGVVTSAVGLGMFLGSLAMSASGGPRRRMHGIYLFSVMQGAALILAGWRPNLTLMAVAFFLFAFSLPLADSCEQVLWQTKTPARMQGRIFAFRRFSFQVVAPFGILAAGPLADRVFEPRLASGGALAASVGHWIGTGAGRGVALLIMTMGAALLALVVAAVASARLRRLEDELPDPVTA